MSIPVARALLAALAALVIGGIVWWFVAWQSDGAWASSSVAPAATVVIAGIALPVSLAVLPRYVDATVDDGVIIVRRVLMPPRRIPLDRVDEIVELSAFVVPGWHASSSTTRIVVRASETTIAAFSPRDTDFSDRCARAGAAVRVVREPLTAAQAHRRFPGAASAGELAAGALTWGALIVGLAAVVTIVVAFAIDAF